MPTIEQVSYMLLNYRLKNSLTQMQAAKELNVSNGTIVNIEKQRKVSPRCLVLVYIKLVEKGMNSFN